MKYIDLHVHSSCSDGTLTPTEIVKHAIALNLSAIALTDHDTVSGVEEAVLAAKKAVKENHFIRIIPGVEISVDYKQKDIHILGLFIDPKNKDLNLALTNALISRTKRNEKMVENLRQADINITMEALQFGHRDTVITRAHFARFLINQGYVKTTKEAFERYLGTDCPYYVSRNYILPKQAISLIKQAGGISILAHPLLYKYTLEEVENLISKLAQAGLDGIEAIYSSNIGFDEGIVRRFANKYHLLISGGSDFHGANKPHLELGIGRGNLKIPYSVLENLENYRKHIATNFPL